MSSAEGVVILQFSDMATSLAWMIEARRFGPTRQTKQSAGERTVPPKFLKLWRIMIPLLVSPARMAMLGSLVRSWSLVSGSTVSDQAVR